jgi:UDP-N-acetylglucosamine 2-epimerase (non-hydrolysing)
VPAEKIHFVGNVMIDTLERSRSKAEASTILADLGLTANGYAVVTMHRPANVDDPQVMGRLAGVFEEVQRDMPIVFPIHPRTRKCLATAGLDQRFAAMKGLRLIEPVGYLDFLKLTASAAVVLTDSGGIQEETTILGVPCLTLRENTERPVTVTQGTNQLVGLDPTKILAAYHGIQRGTTQTSHRPEHWDGQAAKRIARIIADWHRA